MPLHLKSRLPSSTFDLLVWDFNLQTIKKTRKFVSGWYVLKAPSGSGFPVDEFSSQLGQVANRSQLRDIQIRITHFQKGDSLTFEEIGRDEDVFQCPKLIFEEDRCDIQCQEGVSIASMNKKTHFALRSLSSRDEVRYKGLLPRAKFKEKLAAAAQASSLDSTDIICSMSLLVFGVRSIADTLANELSRYHLFLQHPYPVPTHILYENPQYPSMIASSFPNGALLPSISVEAFEPEIEADPCAEELEHDAEDLMAVINSLPRHDYLKEADIDNRIQTTLLRQVDRGQG